MVLIYSNLPKSYLHGRIYTNIQGIYIGAQFYENKSKPLGKATFDRKNIRKKPLECCSLGHSLEDKGVK